MTLASPYVVDGWTMHKVDVDQIIEQSFVLYGSIITLSWIDKWINVSMLKDLGYSIHFTRTEYQYIGLIVLVFVVHYVTMPYKSHCGFRFSRMSHILSVAGNTECCDCGSAEPRWASINLGITLCIECSGIHRWGLCVTVYEHMHRTC